MKKVVLFIGFIFLFACNDGGDFNFLSGTPPTGNCNIANTNFQNLYSTTLSSNTNFTNTTTMDLLTHEYQFTVSSSKNLCKIGYQGNANLQASNLPYTIEVYNLTTSTMVFSGSNVFDSTAISYLNASGTIVPGSTYVVRRILPLNGYLNNLNNTVGRICNFNSSVVPYPIANGALTITASNFYGSGGPVPNFGIPYIDIVFE